MDNLYSLYKDLDQSSLHCLQAIQNAAVCGGAEVKHHPHKEAIVLDAAVAGLISGLVNFGAYLLSLPPLLLGNKELIELLV